MEICEWRKGAGKYRTTCNRQPARIGKGWQFCPFCGKRLTIDDDRSEYQKKYYQEHKEKHAAYYREYYRARKKDK